MKKFLPIVAVASILCLSSIVCAQGGAKQGPVVNRDSDMEKDGLHNLEVARQYFKLRKAYVASLQRCEEVIAGNPEFSKIDEVLFIAGESSLNLAEAKGKQKPDQYLGGHLTSEEFRYKAREYLSQLVNEHPNSKFRDDALAALKTLGGVKAKENKPSQ
jgi:outer membrane protein assembly factor BamD (BamD/ComL family)